MLRDCLPHGIWIETRMTGVSAADDSVFVTSIATSTACRECRIRREDCPGLPQTQPPSAPGHEAVYATVDLDAVLLNLDSRRLESVDGKIFVERSKTKIM